MSIRLPVKLAMRPSKLPTAIVNPVANTIPFTVFRLRDGSPLVLRDGSRYFIRSS